MFPDAPTERGRRDLEELIKLKEKGYNAKLLVLVMRDAECFYPNVRTDKKFSEKFLEALQKGVEVEISTSSLIESVYININFKTLIFIC